MKQLPVMMVAPLLILTACNQVESFEGEVDISEGVLRVGCAEVMNLAESVGVECEVQVNETTAIVDETGEEIAMEKLEGKDVKVVLDGPERIWDSTIGTKVTAEKITVLGE